MSEYVWDDASDIIGKVVGEILGTRIQMTPRRAIAAFFAARVRQRTAALGLLFRDGYYVPAIPVVRAAYEDWLSAAWTLAPADDTRANGFDSDLGAEYARLYRRFLALCGKRAAKAQFVEHPEYAQPFLEVNTDPPHKERDWRGKAVELGLETVHDVAYNYLSDLSHGSFHSFGENVGIEGRRLFEKPAARDSVREEVFALWAFWFELRVLTLAGRQWNLDYEHLSDEWITELARPGKAKTMATCVMRREKRVLGA